MLAQAGGRGDSQAAETASTATAPRAFRSPAGGSTPARRWNQTQAGRCSADGGLLDESGSSVLICSGAPPKQERSFRSFGLPASVECPPASALFVSFGPSINGRVPARSRRRRSDKGTDRTAYFSSGRALAPLRARPDPDPPMSAASASTVNQAGTLRVSSDFLGHQLIVDAIGNVVHCLARRRSVNRPRLMTISCGDSVGIVDANDPSHHQVVDKNLAHFCCPSQTRTGPRPRRRRSPPRRCQPGSGGVIRNQRSYRNPAPMACEFTASSRSRISLPATGLGFKVCVQADLFRHDGIGDNPS